MPNYFTQRTALEICSLNLNGSVRDFLEGCQYLGLDLDAGPDVDIVCHVEDYGGAASTVDVVISCEAMEHDPHGGRLGSACCG